MNLVPHGGAFLGFTTMQKAVQPKRRSGSENRKRSTPVTSRYDDDELQELDQAASLAGLTRAGFQRTQSLAAPKTRAIRRPPIEKEELARLLGQLGKVGSNLNQIAHAANMDQAEDAQINLAVAEVRQAAQMIMIVMGRRHGH